VSGAGAGTTALFIAHEASSGTREAFEHLRRTAGEGVQVRWLLDLAAAGVVPAGLAADVDTFDSREFSQWGYATFGKHMLPGHCHFPVLRHFAEHPGSRYVWTVEYDVRFTGPWSTLFGHFANDDADLLTLHLRTPQQEPRWHWWGTLSGPQHIPPEARRRSLLVVTRYSSSALQHLGALHAAGWRGHQEVLVPTLLARDGLRVADINGAPGARHHPRFYTSRTSAKGQLSSWGTVRYRPPMHRAGLRPNMLYHPVKSRGMAEVAMTARRGRMEKVAYWWQRSIERLRGLGTPCFSGIVANPQPCDGCQPFERRT